MPQRLNEDSKEDTVMICCLSASVLSQKESQGYLGSDCVAIQTHRGKLISHTHYGDPTSAPAPAPTTSAIAATTAALRCRHCSYF